jgi:hypothetical protein
MAAKEKSCRKADVFSRAYSIVCRADKEEDIAGKWAV